MKRWLLSLACCFPLVFSPSTSFSLESAKPGSERIVSFEQYGPISSNETLWRIATKLRPNRSVSVQQTLVAIYKINPYAFYKGNINKVIPESIIKVPTLQFIQTQRNQESAVLIAKYATPRQQAVIAEPKPPQATNTETVEAEVDEAKIDDTKGNQDENSAAQEKLSTLENQLHMLRDELNFVNQQLSLVTAENRSLQLKLQPLLLQLEALKAQLEGDSLIQQQLQEVVESYRAQLAAAKEPGFSSEGLLNAVSGFLKASITHLVLAIIALLLLVLITWRMFIRKNAKALVHEKEQGEEKIRLTAKSPAKHTEQEKVPNAVFTGSVDQAAGRDTAQDRLSNTAAVNSESSNTEKVERPELQLGGTQEITPALSPDLFVKHEQPSAIDHLAEDQKFNITAQGVINDTIAVNSESTSIDKEVHSELQLTDAQTTALTPAQPSELSVKDEQPSAIHHLDENEQFDRSLLEQLYAAEQLEDEQQALPKQDSTEDSLQLEVAEVEEHNFIAIEKLLQKSESESREEPYSELVVDLARAYLEIGDKNGAKKILLSVVKDSDGVQRSEIEKLLSKLA